MLTLLSYIKVKTVAAGDKAECEYIDGVMFRKQLVRLYESSKHPENPPLANLYMLWRIWVCVYLELLGAQADER